MDNLNIKVPKGTRIAVVGDIHEHIPQFESLIKNLQPSEKIWLVSVGDVYDKGYGISAAEEITFKLQELGALAVRGNHEAKHLRRNRNTLSKSLEWWYQRPLCLSFQFESGTRLTVLHAGVTPNHKWNDLYHNIDLIYTRDVDENGRMIPLQWKEINDVKQLVPAKPNGVLWHNLYDGRFGYIASGHIAQKDGIAKFYNYSCNLDSACYATGILSCQIFDETGKVDLLTVSGEAVNPKLDGLD